ncbi:RING finger protein 11 [Scaptodrosophila lebanonensis]|uniref:RING finger protein 11 n=1 Tax=Drosophila lebanonensis TaxID=7225 RepID=A0A6J2TXG0_DROLE|nr:RING finger protein 11 [Scaptodrosophila lebanonensis]
MLKVIFTKRDVLLGAAGQLSRKCCRMGNCLKMSTSDDISLLRGSESMSVSGQDVNSEMFASDPGGGPIFQHESIQQVFYPTPSVSRPASTEDEQVNIKKAKRMGLIQHLPVGTYDGSAKKTQERECDICMVEFCVDEAVRYLPCMHIYHLHCIDDWLMRSLTCPRCLEPVDAALLTSYETT